MRIHYNDECHAIEAGDIYYLCPGYHYVEFIPGEEGKAFSQTVFYYAPSDVSRILSVLSLNYKLEVDQYEVESHDTGIAHAVFPGWDAVRAFFSNINAGLGRNEYFDGGIAADLKMTELLYLIISKPECTLRSRIFSKVDPLRYSLEHVVREHIFCHATISELAEKTNRCATSFKKDFKKHFSTTPQQWFMQQRLNHARLLLVSSRKSVLEIGAECMFRNPVHFNKHFKKQYGVAPSVYRARFSGALGGDAA